MKKVIILLLAAVSLLAIPAGAQHFDPAHRHSLEISTGGAPIHGQSGTSAYEKMMMAISEGITTNRLAIPSLNIGYTYSISELWDFNVVFNTCVGIYRMEQYRLSVPKGTELPDGSVAERDIYDFKGAPESVWTEGKPHFALSADFRIKWYRSAAVKLYSSLGLGAWFTQFGIGERTFPFVPTPYVTPIGVNFGEGHLYGLAEVNISSAASILLVGAGWRF
ncbi:MAG: hypothetical protein K6F25_10460 [Bacteroidales bacterium]|nr:hypothetical protein [Bacteroidales bacterium]